MPAGTQPRRSPCRSARRANQADTTAGRKKTSSAGTLEARIAHSGGSTVPPTGWPSREARPSPTMNASTKATGSSSMLSQALRTSW
ncbi:hypothetical protein [Ornithinimicrobium kibberense]|uniref:hypothetical protein n=1 Tax=Ornithinimicrobium kibberense TaxID=282060 RepID=UPI003618D4C3